MDVLTPYETEHLVKSIEEICVREYSGKQWLSQHEVIYKLNLQSHRNAKAREDEYVQDSMVVHDKIKAIIYNLVVSETWKAKVMPLCYSEIVELPSITSYSLVFFT